MASYTSLVAGAPTAGYFSVNDTYTDSQGVVYICVSGGQAAPAGFKGSGIALFEITDPAQNLGAKSGATVTVLERGAGAYHQSVFTITALPLTILNAVAGNQASGLKIYDYPRGRISLLGVTASITETTTSTLASSLLSSATAKIALGTTIGTNATLATTEVDHAPATTIPVSATINVAGATPGRAALAAAAQFDGTTGTGSQKSIFLNFAVPADADLAGDATITLTGTVRVSWLYLGDF